MLCFSRSTENNITWSSHTLHSLLFFLPPTPLQWALSLDSLWGFCNIYRLSAWLAQREAGHLVEQLGCCGLAIVLGTFSIKFRGQDIGIKLLVVVLQLISVDEHLE